jgi:hypothetical protein
MPIGLGAAMSRMRFCHALIQLFRFRKESKGTVQLPKLPGLTTSGFLEAGEMQAAFGVWQG